MPFKGKFMQLQQKILLVFMFLGYTLFYGITIVTAQITQEEIDETDLMRASISSKRRRFPVLNDSGKGIGASVVGYEGRQNLNLVTPGNDIKPFTARAGELVITEVYNLYSGSRSVAFSPDGRYIATGDTDGDLGLWEVSSGDNIYYKNLGGRVEGVAFSPEGRQLAADGNNGDPYVIILEASSGAEIARTGVDSSSADAGNVRDVAFSPNGNYVAIGVDIPWAWLWEVKSDRMYGWGDTGNSEINAVAFSPDGRYLATGDDDGEAILLEVNRWWSGSWPGVQRLQVGGNVRAVAFSPDGKYLAADGYDGSNTNVTIYDVTRNTTAWRIDLDIHEIYALAFSPKGEYLAVGGDDERITFYRIGADITEVKVISATGQVNSLAWSPDGSLISDGRQVWKIAQPVPEIGSEVNTTVSVSPASVPSPAIGESLTLSINIAGGENVAGYQATVAFDSTTLRYVGSANGDYLPTGAFFVPPAVSGNKVSLAATSLSGESIGDGTLATVTFEVVAVKASSVTLADVVLSDSTGAGLRPEVENGEVVVPPQAQGTSVVLESQKIDDTGSGTFGWSKGNSNGVVEVGEQITFTVTLKNVGTVEAKNVKGTLSAEDKSIESIIVDGEVDYGNIGVGKVSPAPLFDFDRRFTFKIPSVLTTRDAIFTLTVVADNGGPWTIPITVPIINPANIDIEFPEDFISGEAFGTGSTYFTLTAKYPTLAGIPDAAVHYEDCTITLHIPKYTQPFIFPIQTRGEKTLDILQDVSILIAGIIVPGLSQSIEFIELFAKLVNLIGDEMPDLKIQLPKLLGSGSGRPDTEIDFVVLLKNEISSLASIDITITQKYRRGDGSTIHEVEKRHTWNFDEGWAAPAAQPLAFSDYPSFQLLPLEVQQYFLHQFSEFETAAAWQIPDKTIVDQNYPNPFNPETWIPYHLAHTADVVLTIYDTKGAMIRQLDLGLQPAGYYTDRAKAAYWDGRNANGESVASGVYFYQLQAGNYSQVRRMLIVK